MIKLNLTEFLRGQRHLDVYQQMKHQHEQRKSGVKHRFPLMTGCSTLQKRYNLSSVLQQCVSSLYDSFNGLLHAWPWLIPMTYKDFLWKSRNFVRVSVSMLYTFREQECKRYEVSPPMKWKKIFRENAPTPSIKLQYSVKLV